MCNLASKLNDDGCVIDQITFETGEQIYLPGDLKFQKKKRRYHAKNQEKRNESRKERTKQSAQARFLTFMRFFIISQQARIQDFELDGALWILSYAGRAMVCKRPIPISSAPPQFLAPQPILANRLGAFFSLLYFNLQRFLSQLLMMSDNSGRNIKRETEEYLTSRIH